jgi:O-antigen/teichoic acid export membrane protein
VRDSVKHLSKGVAIYGAGDAAIQLVNLLLLAVYVKGGYLVTTDYGALALVGSVEMMAKVISRWGLDGAFMRFYHDRPAGGPLEALTSTIVWFTLAANVVMFGALLAASGALGSSLFADPRHVTAFRLMLINTFLIGVTYIPYHLMRLRNEAVTYSLLMLSRSAGTTIARIVFVIGFGWGLAGWFAADVIVTMILLPVLSRWLRPLLRRRLSLEELRLALRFGLPRLPHGLAQQALDAGNKLLLDRFIPLSQLGVYQNGFTLGTAIRFFTSAFETAWAPFYYGTARQENARIVFSKMTTYGIGVLALLVALTVAVSRDVILVALSPEYLGAVPVVPIIATAMALQGVYLLTSIGLNLTSQTKFYPVATLSALVVGLGSGLWLMPRYGIVGAALAFLVSAGTQTGVAFAFARRVYPVSYEAQRIAKVIAGAVTAAMAGVWLPDLPPAAGLIVRAGVTTLTFVMVLAGLGFFRRTERDFLRDTIRAISRRNLSERMKLQ